MLLTARTGRGCDFLRSSIYECGLLIHRSSEGIHGKALPFCLYDFQWESDVYAGDSRQSFALLPIRFSVGCWRIYRGFTTKLCPFAHMIFSAKWAHIKGIHGKALPFCPYDFHCKVNACQGDSRQSFPILHTWITVQIDHACGESTTNKSVAFLFLW